jgi:hypothetical protein
MKVLIDDGERPEIVEVGIAACLPLDLKMRVGRGGSTVVSTDSQTMRFQISLGAATSQIGFETYGKPVRSVYLVRPGVVVNVFSGFTRVGTITSL